jgi:outer membrane protein assembly factor BamA
MKRLMQTAAISFFSALLLSSLAYAATLAAAETEPDTAAQKKNELVPLPVLFYAPETKTGGGLIVLYTSRKGTSRPSTVASSLIFTQRKQLLSEIFADLYWKDDRYHLTGTLDFFKYADKFYGIGNNTSRALAENYAYRTIALLLNFQKQVRPGWHLGALYRFTNTKITEVEKDGLLSSKTILGSEGGIISGAGMTASWDTRNSLYSPNSGRFYTVSVSRFDGVLGSDYDFTSYNLDLRQYFAMTSTQVLAVQAFMNFIDGNPPFQALSQLGGRYQMRGYYAGRYRDKNLFSLQAEYRLPVWRRFGLVGFAGFGDVAGKLSRFEVKDF